MRFWFSGPRIFGHRTGVSFGPEDLRALRNAQRPRQAGAGHPDGSFVYVVRGGGNLCKIGVSTNPTARLAQLKTASAFPIPFAFIGGTDGTSGYAIEQEAHRILDRCRAEGEWFQCPPELAIAAINGAAAKLGEKLAPIDQAPSI
jgi:T5orf172 domain